MSELINNTIKAIQADAGRRMKMGSFCSAGSAEPCKTTYCLAGWIVAAQPTFDKAEIIKTLYTHYGDPEGQSWSQATENSLDTLLQDRADALLKEEFDIDSFDLFYMHMDTDENVDVDVMDEMAKLCVKAGFINSIADFEGNLSAFDVMPQQVRADAAVRVLEILRDEKKVDWLKAVRYAVEKHVCEKSAGW